MKRSRDESNSIISQPQKSATAKRVHAGKFRNIPETEWSLAEDHFKANPEAVKFRSDVKAVKQAKKMFNPIDSYSFINVNNIIYAMKDGETIGEGSYGRVKMIQNRAGNNFAVKIEGRSKRGLNDNEYKIMQLLKYAYGEAEVPYNKPYKGRQTSHKLYTVTKLRKGEELRNKLYHDTNQKKQRSLKTQSKLIYAIKAAEAIAELHALNVIHGDIKPANFMAWKNKKGKNVQSIDFGFSRMLKEGEKEIISSRFCGSPRYMAPELQKDKVSMATYSFKTDIYALGVMFEHDFKLPLSKTFYEQLLNNDPDKRPTIQQILTVLRAALRKQKNLDPQAQQLVQCQDKSQSKEAPPTSLEQAPKEAVLESLHHFGSLYHSENVQAEPFNFTVDRPSVQAQLSVKSLQAPVINQAPTTAPNKVSNTSEHSLSYVIDIVSENYKKPKKTFLPMERSRNEQHYLKRHQSLNSIGVIEKHPAPIKKAKRK